MVMKTGSTFFAVSPQTAIYCFGLMPSVTAPRTPQMRITMSTQKMYPKVHMTAKPFSKRAGTP